MLARCRKAWPGYAYNNTARSTCTEPNPYCRQAYTVVLFFFNRFINMSLLLVYQRPKTLMIHQFEYLLNSGTIVSKKSTMVLPSMFLPHGSPPIPIEACGSSDWLAGAAATLPSRPTAIVFMSPHTRYDGRFEG